MRQVLIGFLLTLACVSVTPTSSADGGCREVKKSKLENGFAIVYFETVCDAPDQAGSGSAFPAGVLAEVDRSVCLATAQLLDLPASRCDGPEVDRITPELVLAAFSRTRLPPSELVIEPPDGRTLVNFATNFYTEPADFTRTITLLGRRVELRIFAAGYTWHFDDGRPMTTTSPGSAYPDLEITHDYRRKGSYAPSVDTTYGADWRVGDGAWQRVAGTVTITGDAVALEAVEARPTLVS